MTAASPSRRLAFGDASEFLELSAKASLVGAAGEDPRRDGRDHADRLERLRDPRPVHFGFEGRTRGDLADLKAAYRQLLDYREDLENPPLLIVSDIERIEVHTNFTGLKPVVETITLDEP
jgi:hypothetical protein